MANWDQRPSTLIKFPAADLAIRLLRRNAYRLKIRLNRFGFCQSGKAVDCRWEVTR
jgi:hypothetical protein